MKHRIGKKLKSRSGESIGEVLVAVLISALALALLAGMVVSASRIVTQSKQALGRYVAAENALTMQSGEGTSGQVTITDSTGAADSVAVLYYTERIGGKDVTSYRIGKGDGS